MNVEDRMCPNLKKDVDVYLVLQKHSSTFQQSALHCTGYIALLQ